MYIEWIIIRSTYNKLVTHINCLALTVNIVGLFKITPNISHNSLLEMKSSSENLEKAILRLFFLLGFAW